MDDNVEVALIASTDARFAVAGGAQTGAVRDSGRDLNFNSAGLLRASFAIAGVAWLFDDFPETATTRTGLRDLEESTGTDDLAPSMACAASDRA